MEWSKLINDKRFGLEHIGDARNGVRSDFERDYDRLAFSSAFRRLQNKTQVFPLPGNIFVHNRLTHSIEVACVGRSLASEVVSVLAKKYSSQPWVEALRGCGEIVAAACLAHDLGNPPFGHSGEATIRAFFTEGPGNFLRDMLSPAQWDDLTCFDGNANSFRVLTHQFKGRRPGGFAMTYSTLAAIVKYPWSSSHAGNRKKFGFFTTEAEAYERIASELGILKLGDGLYCRHPLVYLVEAADDICYQVMDIEDAHKLKIVSLDEVMQLFSHFFADERWSAMQQAMARVGDPNEKVAYMRSCVVNLLVHECASVFLSHEQEIMEGAFVGSLIENMDERAAQGYRNCSKLAYERLYRASYVVDVDLAGTRIFNLLLERLISAVMHPGHNDSRLLLYKVPQQYDVQASTLFEKVQACIDHISAMTDVYALNLYRELNGISLPTV